MELRAEHARLQRAIEHLERLYDVVPIAPRLKMKRLGRPRKAERPTR